MQSRTGLPLNLNSHLLYQLSYNPKPAVIGGNFTYKFLKIKQKSGEPHFFIERCKCFGIIPAALGA
jgi:hypothetical protein